MEGIYPLGTAMDKLINPCGYWEKRWGGGKYVQAGLPDMHITINGIGIDVELKAANGHPSELQKHNIRQINKSGCFAVILYPDGFEDFKAIVRGVKACSYRTAELRRLFNVVSNTNCDMLTD